MPIANAVTRERDNRLVTQFQFEGHWYDHSEPSQLRILKLHTMALSALERGKQPGDLRWRDENEDFFWIAKDNTRVPMDAPTALAFAEAAFDFEYQLVKAARTLKDSGDIPEDYADDKHWTA